MSNELPTILVIEDDPSWIENYQRRFSRYATVLTASTHEEARRLFNKNHALIIMDGVLGKGSTPNTLELIKEFRAQGFTKPIVAASGTDNKSLKQAGCDYGPDRPDKVEVLAVVTGLLSKMQMN